MSGLFGDVLGVANFVMGYKNMEYQKALQKTMFQREDTAVQRRVADLRAAGLSPTLAAGSAASAGPTVATQAPQFDTSIGSEGVQAVQGMLQAHNNIAQTEEQNKLLKLQQDKTLEDTSNAKAQHAQIEAMTAQSKANAYKTLQDAEQTRLQNDASKKSGVPPGTGGFMGQLVGGAGVARKYLDHLGNAAGQISDGYLKYVGRPFASAVSQVGDKYKNWVDKQQSAPDSVRNRMLRPH